MGKKEEDKTENENRIRIKKRRCCQVFSVYVISEVKRINIKGRAYWPFLCDSFLPDEASEMM